MLKFKMVLLAIISAGCAEKETPTIDRAQPRQSDHVAQSSPAPTAVPTTAPGLLPVIAPSAVAPTTPAVPAQAPTAEDFDTTIIRATEEMIASSGGGMRIENHGFLVLRMEPAIWNNLDIDQKNKFILHFSLYSNATVHLRAFQIRSLYNEDELGGWGAFSGPYVSR